MSVHYTQEHFDVREVIDLVLRERASSLSAREWKHRIAGYGYAVTETLRGQVVQKLPHGTEICVLPAPETA
ncbi:MAG: hypothetical protein AAF943_01260 [Pseudomonadota bacterium]